MSYTRHQPRTMPTVPVLQRQIAELLHERAALRQTVETLTAQLRAMNTVPANHRKPTAVCGTYSGYMKHIRAEETPCYPCKAARAEYTREYRKRNLRRTA